MAENEEGGEEPTEEVHDWSAFYDDEGRLYYYNSKTEESSWEAPEKFNPPPDSAPAAESGEPAVETAEVATGEEEPAASQADGTTSGVWTAYPDDEGRTYYYNNETGETQWEKPEGFEEPTTEKDETEVTMEAKEEPAADVSMEEAESVPPAEEVTKPEEEEKEEPREPEEEIDPAVKRLKEAEEALNRPDAIMEPGCMSHVTEVVTSDGGNPQRAIQSLSESFCGQTAICGLIGRWVADLRSASSSSSEQEKSFSAAADKVREMTQDVVTKIAMERFSKTGGDSILNLSKSEAAFLEDMMDSNRWRKLLIDLSATHKDSALLMYCLRSISKRGHHREITKRVNPSDHFAVFNAMLVSELAVLGQVAVNANSDIESLVSMDDLVSDLRRTCTSTSYTYLYAVEVFRHLITTAKKIADEEGATASWTRSIRNWERLCEEIDDAMLDPSASATTAGSTPLFRRRRLDVALTISELHQRQRRRLNPEIAHEKIEKEKTSLDARETAVLTFLRRHALGTTLDDRTLDNLLPNQTDTAGSREIGRLLITYPLAVKALLGHLFRPGSSRNTSVVMKNKCARLVTLSVLAAESTIEGAGGSPEFDEVTLTRMVLQSSKLCEDLESLVSFIVTNDVEDKKYATFPGIQLCKLVIKSAPIALGAVMWAKEFSNGREFLNSPAYPTMSPCILSLVRIICLQHPFTRPEVLQVALGFLKHSNTEISHQKMNAIKEQSARLLLFLLTKGDVVGVLGNITKRLKQQGNNELDPSLIRYFVGGLFEVVRAPVSLPFLRLLGDMLKTQKCIEAVRSKYFGEPNRVRLISLLESSKESIQNDGGTNADSSLVASLEEIYAKSL